MMNVLSECSSGCESGWTLYLEHSTSHFSVSHKKRTSFCENQQQKFATFDDEQYHKHNNNGIFVEDEDEDEDEEEDEDLSMVSDASSGPPHFDHHDNIDEEEEVDLCYNNNNNNNNNNNSNNIGKLRRRSSIKSYANEITQCCNNDNTDDFSLDDTASSSHVFTSEKIGGVHVQNQGVPFERLIDYQAQSYSATQVVQGKSSNFHESCGYFQPSYSTDTFHQHNQWA